MSVSEVAEWMADDFFRQHGQERAELVKGQIVRWPIPGSRHGFVTGNTTILIGSFVKSNQLGRVMDNDTLIRVQQNPDTVRGADVL